MSVKIPNDHRAVTRMPQEAPAKGAPPEPDTTTAPETAVLGREMAKGTGWMVGARLAVQGIGVLSTIVLARLLVPADFGLVALATTFSAALQAVSEFSFDVVLIQNQRATRQHYDTAWTLSICRNAILAVALAASARLVASLFGDPRLEMIVYCLAVATLMDGFQNIGIVDFRKQLNFRRDFIFMVVAKLGAFVITVPLAFAWRNYWALVLGIVGGTVIRLALSYMMHGFRPKLTFAHWREIMHFSKWLVLVNIGGFLYNRSDTFVLGKLAGAQVVGVYSIAFEIANMVTSNLITPLRRAIFPAYSKLSDDVEALRKAFIDVFGLVALVGMPAAVGLGVVAEPLVHVMLGAKWLGAIPLIQVLSIYGFLSCISAGSGPIFLARARPEYTFWVLGGGAVIMIPLLFVGVRHAGAVGAAWAVTVAAAVAGCADFALVCHLLRLSPLRLFAVAWRPVLASVVMAFAVIELRTLLPVPGDALEWGASLGASVGAGLLVFPSALLVLWTASGRPDGPERQVVVALWNALMRDRFVLSIK